MSRHPFAGASHRLHLGEHALVLDRLEPGGGAVTLARVTPPPGGMVQALRALAAEIDGPVVAVLPAEVFRTRPSPTARAARRTAEAALAVALGVPARATRFAEVAAGERRVLVAVPRSTLSQTAAFLAAVDIALAAVEPEATLFPGMPVPRFELATSPRPALAALHAHLRARFATALGTLALPRPGPRAAVLAGAGLLALTALWGLARPEVDQALPGTTVGPEATASVEVPPPPIETAAPEPPATTLAQPPQPRPRALPPLTLLTSAAPLERRPAPVGLGAVPSASDGTLAVTMASRSLPLAVPETPTAAEAARQAAGATEPERPAVESYPRVAALGPVARPSPDAAPPQATERTTGISDAVRPVRRPGATTAAAPNAAQPAPVPPQVPPQVPAPAGERPVARPGTPAPSLEAAIAAALAETTAAAPSDAGRAAAGLAAAVATGVRPAPRSLPPVPEVPRRAVATVAPPPPAQPVTVAALATAAQPPVQLVPTAAPPRQAPQAAPVRQVVRAAPQPARTPPPATVARAAPAAAPAAAPPAPQQQASPGRGPVALVGVFGSADRRHALLQMPNGSIQRVRAGQTVAGVQVAAVAGDSVRVLVNGRESTLRLPD